MSPHYTEHYPDETTRPYELFLLALTHTIATRPNSNEFRQSLRDSESTILRLLEVSEGDQARVAQLCQRFDSGIHEATLINARILAETDPSFPWVDFLADGVVADD